MKKKGVIILVIILLLIIISLGVGLFIFYNTKSDLVYSEVYVEAGTSDCDVTEFLKREEPTAHFTKDSEFDPRVPGDYELKIAWEMPVFGIVTDKTILHVQDTVAPEVQLATDSVDMYVTAQAPSRLYSATAMPLRSTLAATTTTSTSWATPKAPRLLLRPWPTVLSLLLCRQAATRNSGCSMEPCRC